MAVKKNSKLANFEEMNMISIFEKAILYNNKEIYDALAPIRITHIFNYKILLLYNSNGLIPPYADPYGDKKIISPEHLEMVNRNILMLDFDGQILWRIASDEDYYNPWTVVGQDEGNPQAWFASTRHGYQYTLDVNTGALSNGIFMR